MIYYPDLFPDLRANTSSPNDILLKFSNVTSPQPSSSFHPSTSLFESSSQAETIPVWSKGDFCHRSTPQSRCETEQFLCAASSPKRSLLTHCSAHEIAELKHYLSPFSLVLPGIFFFLGCNSDFFWFMPAHTVSDTKTQSSPAFSTTPGAPWLR